ncbi:MAG: ACT domain-containing protein [Phycisphaerae bacterium]
MGYEIAPVDVWVAELRNRPGELARVLNGIVDAGGHLEFIVGRPHDAGSSAVFVAPLTNEAEIAAGEALGLHRSQSLHAVRVAGPDQSGLGARVTAIIAKAGINLRGITAASIGAKSVLYIRFETEEAANKGVEILQRSLK